MKITILILAVLGIAEQAPAQEIRPAVVRPDYDAVRQYLVLSESQVTQLKQLQESRQQADQAVFEQIMQRQRQVDQLLAAGSTDAATIGRLMVEINGLRKQIPNSGRAYRPQALAVLTEQQKARLPQLEEALRTQRPAGEAVALNLIDYPDPGDVRILPWPALAEPAGVVRPADVGATR
jgi:hypothetical protein